MKDQPIYDFIAVDLENADSDRLACSLGVAAVKNKEIVFTKYWLIKPGENRYGNVQMMIHGITPKHTANEPEFPAFYKELEELFNNEILVAHNCSSDRSILNKTCQYYGLNEFRPSQWICTHKTLNIGTLKVCCDMFNIPLDHHNALSDAIACAKLYLHYLNNPGIAKEKISKPSENIFEVLQKRKLKGEILEKPDLESVENKETFFYNKQIVITGATSIPRIELAKKLKNLGADIQSGISKHIDIVIIGDKPGPMKIQKIENLQQSGYNIVLMTEDQALGCIN